ncbi:MAG: ABC transporter ATP-binding protein [Myxococcota bacterium]|nr:ABC transporter ATP-binding protein [Myxococcota bacterium]
MKNLLAVKDLSIEFDTKAGRKRVVDSISFQVGEGEVLGVLGESGSGKTITTSAVLGLIQGNPGVVNGQILLSTGDETLNLLAGLGDVMTGNKGIEVKNVRRWDRLVSRRMKSVWGSQMTAVFQNPRASLDPLIKVGTQVAESVALAHPDWTATRVRDKALDWLQRVQLNAPERVYVSYAHELSGGMCQRVMVAVALAREPRLLIADEPTTGLDTTVRAEIVKLFASLIDEENRAMMYISHDVREVLYLADRVIVMKDGVILETSTAHDIRHGYGQRAPYTQFLLESAGIFEGDPNA